jgi:broad specificity phosphatase PhoE
MIPETFPSIVRHPLFAMALRFVVFLPAIFFAADATAQPPAIFLVRHAERAAISGHVPSDTGLSPAGRKRAEALAQVLKDARITAVYTTEYKRTRETAAPIAQLLGIQPEVIPGDDLRELIAKLKASSGNVLVIGHSNTLPQIISALGGASRVTVAEADYDNLFLVVLERSPRLIHLHYR